MTMGAIVTVLSLMAAGAAGASCRRPPVMEESAARADLVFVGTPVELTHGGRWASVAVEDIWKGEPDGDRVEVRAGPQSGFSSVDRTYVLGTRYLVFAMAPPVDPRLLASYGEGVKWTDNECSFTQPYSSSLAESRPSTARLIEHPSPQPPDAVSTEAGGVVPARATPPPRATPSRGWMHQGWTLAIVAVVAFGLAAGAVRSRRRTRIGNIPNRGGP